MESPAARKAKKKQGKGELDRLKQAEKKRRRLEKALATSAAIRTELEMKKQKKKEEQQRLDEEGAAIAEAVALRVLVEEDSDEECRRYQMGLNWGECSASYGRELWETADLTGIIAAQAFASLGIADVEGVD